MPRPWLKILLCLLLIPGAAASAAPLPSDGLMLFLLAGQSNMSGRGELGRLPPGFPSQRSRIAVFNNAYQWCGPDEPLDSAVGQKDACSTDTAAGVGPGAAFAQALAELMPSARVGLVPCAKGASSLRRWAPVHQRDTLYGSCLARARAASARGKVRGVLFYQGESDAHSRAAVRAWPLRFAELVAAWRRDLGNPLLPVVYCQIGSLGPELRDRPRYRYWDLLKQRQAAVSIPGVAMVRTDDLPLKPDGLHLSTAGQLILGRRLAQAMHRLLLRQGSAGGGQNPPHYWTLAAASLEYLLVTEAT
eukprot:TRINITY_DN2883_c0_g2_i1.p1 TRINITY_DN2883_c0_g2~~TRINITY_DN2883_c0_g2_i1.p1  ORF type:complete len:304 (+),score=110.65 TRINITY_DN2883_c0_g2_i1:765-1676(+)